MERIESPVKVINEFLDEVIQYQSGTFVGAFIGPVLPVVERNLGSIAGPSGTFYLEYNDDEEALILDKYISPVSRRRYVDLSARVYVKSGDETYELEEGTHYTIDPNEINILSNVVNIGSLLATSVVSLGASQYRIKLRSFITNKGYAIKEGDTITDGTNSWTINTIERDYIIVSGTGTPPVDYITVNRSVTGELWAKYRVFKKFNEVIKIDSISKLNELFGPEIDDQNILAWGIKLAYSAMEAPKAIYAIPYSSQENPAEALNRLRDYREPGVYLIDNAILDFNPDVIQAAINLTSELADPKFSSPVRFFISYDAPLYEYEWKWLGETYGSLSVPAAEREYYTGVGGDLTEISSARMVGKVISFTTPIDINPGTTYLIKFYDALIKWTYTGSSTISTGTDVDIDNYEVIYGSINPTKVRNAAADSDPDTAGIGEYKEYVLDSSSWSSSDVVYIYSVTPMTITDLYNYYISLSPNNEYINIVNPWVFTTTKERAPGFYLAAMKAGFTIGKTELVQSTAFWKLPRTYIWNVDYGPEVWGNRFELVVDKGFDLHLVYRDELISWLERTSYYGVKQDKRYQHAMRAVIIVTYLQKAIGLQFVRKYTLDSFNINGLKTAIQNMLTSLTRKELGPVLTDGKVKDIVLIRNPKDLADLPYDIPVSMESGLLIVCSLKIPKITKEIIFYNLIGSEQL